MFYIRIPSFFFHIPSYNCRGLIFINIETMSKAVLNLCSILLLRDRWKFSTHCFQLLGLGLLIPGILMLVDVDVINDQILPLLQQLSFGALNVGDLAKGLSVTLIIFGTFVLIVSMFGCCGAFCQQRLCLVVVSRV